MGNPFAAVTDLETTGLEARKDVPLEIGVRVIEKDGRIIDSISMLVYEAGGSNDYSKGMARGMANEFVREMHTKSGLWEDLRTPNRPLYTRHEAEVKLISWLESLGVEPRKLPMMGNSIGSLDRPFCIEHFPKFNAFLSHRNIDMSTIRELLKAHNPELWENLVPILGTSDDTKHRVLDDVDSCINEYLTYLDEFLITA